jgi:ABC-2 type transport system ATP-binding protein
MGVDDLLEVECLTKSFGALRALKGISFAVPRGAIIGLLGPNGAGKTTCIDILLGATTPDSGSVRYFGRDFFADRSSALSRINFASAYHNLQNRISVRQNLLVFAHLYEVPEPKRTIERMGEYFEILGIMDRRFGDLSAGQRTRVSLIKSLLNNPELVLMDEPTASLDPDIADKTLGLIEELRRERGLSILFTSHRMDEVNRLCDEVIFLDRGEVVSRGRPAELTAAIPEAEVRLTLEGSLEAVQRYLLDRGLQYRVEGRDVVVTALETQIARLIHDADQLSDSIIGVDVKKTDLEDVFLAIARRSDVV